MQLRIASFQISANELAAIAKEVTGEAFDLVRMGSRDELAAYNKRERVAHPYGEQEVYPDWPLSFGNHPVENGPLCLH